MSYLTWSGGKTVINYPEMNLKNVKTAFMRIHILREGLAESWTMITGTIQPKKKGKMSVILHNQGLGHKLATYNDPRTKGSSGTFHLCLTKSRGLCELCIYDLKYNPLLPRNKCTHRFIWNS